MPVERAAFPAKKNICEACRKAKRRCSGSQPCERCVNSGVKCVRVKHWQPEDLQYIQLATREKLNADVEDLYDQLDKLESKIQSFKDGTDPESSETCASESSDSTWSPATSYSDVQMSPCSVPASPITQSTKQMGPQFAVFVNAANNVIESYSKDDNTNHNDKAIQLFRKSTNERPEWTLTLKSSGLTINTSIKTFADMVYYLPQLTSFAMKNADVPIPSHVRDHLQSLHLKRIQSPWFALRRAILVASQQSIERMRDIKLLEQDTQGWMSDEAANQMAHRLIKSYFQCQHYRRIIIHRRTFLDLFVKGKDNILSPAVCAFSAAITSMRCRHVLGIIPHAQRFAAGEYFFSKARDLFADLFDEISLENYFTLVWMAKYKVGVLKVDEAQYYVDMAERQCDLLAPRYMSDSEPSKLLQKDMGHAEMYRRLYLARRDIMSSVRYLQNRRGVPLATARHTFPGCISKEDHFQPSPPRIMSDDTISEKRALLRDRFAHMLDRARELGIKLRWAVINEVSLGLISQYEQRLKDWYWHTLPPELRLSLPLLDDSLTYEDLCRRLKKDPHADRMTIDLALNFYSSFISLHEMLLPKLSQYAQHRNDLWPWENPEAIFDPPAEPNSVETELATEHTMRSQRVCTQAANIIVDLLKYQVEELGLCHIEMPILTFTWDIQLRNAQLGNSITNDAYDAVDKKMIARARQNLITCIEVAQNGYLLNSAEGELQQFLFNMSDRTRQALAREQ